MQTIYNNLRGSVLSQHSNWMIKGTYTVLLIIDFDIPGRGMYWFDGK
jgi:hypothetical protein